MNRNVAVPVPTAEFVGREHEFDRCVTLLIGPARLVTLTGLGGAGKTQLAAQVARRYGKVKSAPVYWVRLARVPKDSGVAVVVDEIARSVAGSDTSAESAWHAVAAALGDGPGPARPAAPVLVLDNCEHVLDSVDAVVGELLRTTPALTVLATSRRPIGRDDEHPVVLSPLTADEALELFRHRAEAHGRPITDPAQVEIARAICRHMHHNPLFVRLAAARVRRRPLPAILAELNDEERRAGPMTWRHGSPRPEDAVRHRGIGDAIAWSYELCTERERLLFERMSVFAAGGVLDPNSVDPDIGVTVEAIEAVCADDADHDAGGTTRLRRDDIGGVLDRLVDQSLIDAHRHDSTVRYSMLECLQLFAHRRLSERGATDEPRRLAARHLRYFHDELAALAVGWFGPGERAALDWIRAAWPNVLIAIRTGTAFPDTAALALRMCFALHALPIPAVMSSLRELRSLTERALAAERSRAEFRTTATALLAADAVRQGLRSEAEDYLAQCFSSCGGEAAQGDDADLPGAVGFAKGLELWLVHKNPLAVETLTGAGEKYRAAGETGMAGQCDVAAMAAASALLPGSGSAEPIRRVRQLAAETGSQWAMMWADAATALAALQQGRGVEALDSIDKMLSYRTMIGNQLGMVILLRIWALTALIGTASHDTDHTVLASWARQAAHLAGVVGAFKDALDLGMQKLPDFAERTERALDAARQVIGAEAFDAAFRRGARMPLEFGTVERLARGTLTAAGSRTDARALDRADGPWATLSRAERHVAILAAAGLTNTVIAARRATSVRTVDAQMTTLLHKLSITSRRDIAGHIPPHRIDDIEREAGRRSTGKS
ncbi:ATP-binding protein [Nocardia fusca]|uniref:ATP-binding protein n=1 Tax=Nocardia fusca TaxID=941183 RepID=UPI0037B6A8D2